MTDYTALLKIINDESLNPEVRKELADYVKKQEAKWANETNPFLTAIYGTGSEPNGSGY